MYNGKSCFQRLFHGTDSDFFKPFSFDVRAFGMLAIQQGDLIYAKFNRFLYEPLNAVCIFSRGDGNVNEPGLGVFLSDLSYPEITTARIRFSNNSSIERPLTIRNVDTVPRLLAKHFNAVPGFFCIQVKNTIG